MCAVSNSACSEHCVIAEPWFCTFCLETLFPFNHIDDDFDFLTAIRSSLNHSQLLANQNSSSNLCFHSTLIDEHRELLNNMDLDPDVNYYNAVQIPYSEYVTSTDLNMLYSKVHYENSFSIFHANCRSLSKNFNNLTCTVSLIEPALSVIAVSETWLSPGAADLFHIPGYSFVEKSRILATGGGVGLYIHNSFMYKSRVDLSLDDINVDSIFVELTDLDIIVGCVYRKPNTDIKMFNILIDRLLTKITTEKKTSFIAGDFNINILKSDVHADTGNFVDCLFSNLFFPTINRPTRITESSVTLIDNIITNASMINPLSCIMYSDISDHLPVFLSVDLKKPAFQKPCCYYARCFGDKNVQQFIRNTAHIDWNLYSSDYDSFISALTAVFDATFPLQRWSTRNKAVPRKPWMTRGLARSCKRKEKLYKIFIKNPSEANACKYKTYRNKLNKLVRMTEKKYYEQKFLEATNDMKKTWKIIKNIISKNKSNIITDTFLVNGKKTVDKNIIVNKFNEYFVNVGPSLANKIQSSNVHYQQFLCGNYPNSFALFFTTPEEVIKVTNELANKTSAGYDNISISLIKKIIPFIAKPLSELVNKSFETGIVPDQLKIARVCPIYKSGDPCSFSNYRPISVLPGFSKIIEKLVHLRLMSYLTKHSILINNQYGFRNNHDTSLAVIDMIDNITEKLDSGYFSLGLFIDLSKAFDTLDHRILINKLEFYGIRGKALEWFKSYLTNRQQYVQYNGVQSNIMHIKTGVPQGSILGPLLFLIYINDIVKASELLYLILFADDTNVFIYHKDPKRLQDMCNTEIDRLSQWFKANKLSLNITKTNYILYSPRSKSGLQSSESFSVELDGTRIERVSYAKFLGVYIDDKLTWHKHIQEISTKISKNIGIMSRISYKLNSSILLKLYNTLILPYLSYCNMIWTMASDTVLTKLFILQKRLYES